MFNVSQSSKKISHWPRCILDRLPSMPLLFFNEGLIIEYNVEQCLNLIKQSLDTCICAKLNMIAFDRYGKLTLQHAKTYHQLKIYQLEILPYHTFSIGWRLVLVKMSSL